MPFAGPDRRQKILVLLAMCFALFMAMLDNTVVNVALPTISRKLGAGFSDLQWVVDGYVLAMASLMLTGGIAGDRFGRKRTFLAGLGIFTLASLLCGLAGSTTALIAFRALQGAGAALLSPGTLAILTNTFPVEERAQAIGIWAGVSGLALALGPTTGGWLVEHVGWQSVFFLNVPIGIAGFVIASTVVHESRAPRARRLDAAGLVLGTAMLTSITYALIEANRRGWGDGHIVGALVLGAVLLVAFVMWERRVDEPMMPLSLYRIPAFATGNLVAFAISFGMFGTVFFFALYFQLIRGYTPFEAGVRFLPITGMIVFVAPLAGKMSQRYGSRWPLTFGLTLAGTGLLMMSRITPTTPFWVIAPILMTMGIGMGSTMTPMTAAVMNAVGPARAGLGSAASNTAREVGGTFGVAFLGTLLSTVLKRSLRHLLATSGLAAPVRDAIVASAGHGRIADGANLPPALAATVQHAFAQAFVDGFRVALTVAGLAILVIAVVANRFIDAGTPVAAASPDLAAAHPG